MLKVKKKCVFFLLGIVYLKKGLMFVLLINHKIINTMNTIILTITILLVLFCITFILIDSNNTAKAEKIKDKESAEMWAKIIKDNNLI